jgi:pimeloyl-ACP methyl ester carboxylesterase
VISLFTPAHRGGSGPPLVLLHGFTDTWRTWELVLPALQRRHDVLAPTLAGHAGGPPLPDPPTGASLADAVEAAMDAAGFETAHVAGNSLGGFVALQLAARGRARSVVALAPAGGWAEGDDELRATLDAQDAMLELLQQIAPQAGTMAATPEGRRRATAWLTEHGEDLPSELVAHLVLGAAGCRGGRAMIELARRGDGYPLDPQHVTCPVRIVWGTADRMLAWPTAAHRFRRSLNADWVVLDGVGHCPQLDVPLEAAELILGYTGL